MMGAANYVPLRGDVVQIHARTREGSDRSTGRSAGRPAVAVSPESYNRRVGLALFCPVAAEEKGYPFEVAIPGGLPASCVILADQLESVGWRSRAMERVCALPRETVDDVLRKAAALLDGEDRP